MGRFSDQDNGIVDFAPPLRQIPILREVRLSALDR